MDDNGHRGSQWNLMNGSQWCQFNMKKKTNKIPLHLIQNYLNIFK